MAKSWKEITSEEEVDQITVSLAPVLGIPPRLYVPIVWGTIVALLLFLVLVLPGFRAYGTVLTVTSSPAGAEVFIDGHRHGSTPLETFVEAGERLLEVRHGGFPHHEQSISLGGRRFAASFFPARKTVSAVFGNPETEYLEERLASDFAAWALGPEPGPQFQHPPVARDGSRAIWAAGDPDYPLDRLLRNVLAHGQHFQGADMLGAAFRAANPGGVMHAGNVGEVVNAIIHIDKEYPGFHAVLDELDPTGTIASSEWYRKRADELSTSILAASIALDEGLRPQPQDRIVAAETFVYVPAGTYTIGYPLRNDNLTGVPVDFSSGFWIQSAEVTRGSFARFIMENRDWRPETVRSAGYPDYLRDWPHDWERWSGNTISRDALLPVRYLPREAAEAFARWMHERSGLTGETVRLPRAKEWEYAAFLNDPGHTDTVRQGFSEANAGPRGALGASRMAGNLWEWTMDWYGVNAHILEADYGHHVAVMGGSFANPTVTHSLRGAQPPGATTPFLGFRLVIIPETIHHE